MNSDINLKNLTADKLVEILPQDAIEILLEIYLKNKIRVGHLVEIRTDQQNYRGGVYTIITSYTGSKEEILRQIIEDPKLESERIRLIHPILKYRLRTIKKDPFFEKVVKSLRSIGGEYEDWMYEESKKIKYIKYLYTEILSLEDFIEDLVKSNVFNRAGYQNYFVIFEDEASWKHVKAKCVELVWNCAICSEPVYTEEHRECYSCVKIVCNKCESSWNHCDECAEHYCDDCFRRQDILECGVCTHTYHTGCQTFTACSKCDLYICDPCKYDEDQTTCRNCKD